MEKRRLQGVGRWGIVVGLSIATALTIRWGTAGLQHDDGLYLISAQSVARGEGYRLPSLPGNPRASKYPPLYPFLLSVVMLAVPLRPDTIAAFKLVNIIFLSGTLLLFGVLARDRLDDELSSTALTISLGLSPIVVVMVGSTMSETLFLFLTLGFVLAWRRAVTDVVGTASFAAAILLVALLATKAVGVAIALAAVCDAARKGRVRLAGVMGFVTLVWLVAWRLAQPASPASPLLAYYLSYEPSLLAMASNEPLIALSALVDSVRAYWTFLPVTVGPAWATLPAFSLFVAGLWIERKSFEVLILGMYFALLLLYPGYSPRYLLPLVPLYLLLAARAVVLVMSAVPGPAIGRVLLALLTAVSILPMAQLIRDGSARAAPNWQGFMEISAWLKANTRGDALVASGYDPVYYLFAGRGGVRPWHHASFTYYFPRGNPRPDVGDASDVLNGLRELGVDFLVVEPMNLHVEGKAVEALLTKLVAIPGAVERVYASSDHNRVIYRIIPSHAEVPPP